MPGLPAEPGQNPPIAGAGSVAIGPNGPSPALRPAPGPAGALLPVPLLGPLALDRELMAPFQPPGLQHPTARWSSHPGAEAMRSHSLSFLGLVCSLRHSVHIPHTKIESPHEGSSAEKRVHYTAERESGQARCGRPLPVGDMVLSHLGARRRRDRYRGSWHRTDVAPLAPNPGLGILRGRVK